MKIKITTVGIYGLVPTDDNASGEYPIGHVLDIGENEPPPGWAGRYIVVEENAPKGAKMVTADEKPAKSNDVSDDSSERGTESKDDADQPRRGPGRPKGN